MTCAGPTAAGSPGKRGHRAMPRKTTGQFLLDPWSAEPTCVLGSGVDASCSVPPTSGLGHDERMSVDRLKAAN